MHVFVKVSVKVYRDINCAIFECLQIRLDIELIIKNEEDRWNIRLELYR